MKTLPLLTLVLLFCIFAGCSVVMPLKDSSNAGFPGDEALWRIRLKNGEDTVFAGILAMKKEGVGQYISLLDSSGIKLFDGYLEPEGRVRVANALPSVREKGLPDFIGRSLFRIFQQDPGAGKCYEKIVKTICRRASDPDMSIVAAKFLVFEIWSVTSVRAGAENAKPQKIYLDNFWPAPDVEMVLLEAD